MKAKEFQRCAAVGFRIKGGLVHSASMLFMLTFEQHQSCIDLAIQRGVAINKFVFPADIIERVLGGQLTENENGRQGDCAGVFHQAQ